MLKTLETVLNGFRWSTSTTILLEMLEFFLFTPKWVHTTPETPAHGTKYSSLETGFQAGSILYVYPSHPLSIAALSPPHL